MDYVVNTVKEKFGGRETVALEMGETEVSTRNLVVTILTFR